MPAVSTHVVLANATLFRAILSTKRLKDMVASAKAISDDIILEFDSDNDKRAMRYWAVDPDQTCAMVGLVDDSVFEAMDGDDELHTIQVPAKHLVQCIGAFDSEKSIMLKLTTESNQHVLTLQQSKDEGSEPDVRKITVVLSDSKPKAPVTPKGAYAAVDLRRFGKVLAGLKQSTDIVLLSVRPGEFEVSTTTRKMQDGWTHATDATGKAQGIFAVAFLRKVVAGAVKVGAFGEVHLTDDYPLRVESVSEDLHAIFHVAGRNVMEGK